jgi:hypothetical protein
VARPSAPVIVAISLPVLLALAVAGLAITARAGGFDQKPVAETGPLVLAPVDAPDATGPDCTALLAALPPALDGPDGPLPSRPIGEPVQAGARAWAAAPRPVVLRCGLPRPQELTPTSQLLVVNGVQWLKLDDGVPDPDVFTYVAVDRPAYVALTSPVDIGAAPLQQVSDVVRLTMRSRPIQVR